MSNKDVVIDADFTEVDQDGNVKDDVQQVQNTEEKKETFKDKVAGFVKKNGKFILGMAIGAIAAGFAFKKFTEGASIPAQIPADIPASIPDQVVPNAATPDTEAVINGIVDEIKNNTI